MIKDGFNRHYGEYLMLFASDRTGNLDIYLTHNYRNNPTGVIGNSGQRNGYCQQRVFGPGAGRVPELTPPTMVTLRSIRTVQPSTFTSNRGGSFDIYRAPLPAIAPTDLQNQLVTTLTDVAPERVDCVVLIGR